MTNKEIKLMKIS